MAAESPGLLPLLLGLAALAAPGSAAPRIGASVVAPGAPPPVAGAAASRKYLVASFPVLKQVAYVHLPDDVWRPLVIGEVASPGAVAVDAQNARLFVADPPSGVVWWYKLGLRPNGLLVTLGPRHAAVENYNASSLAVNSVGDLYFSGRHVSATTPSLYDSIFRQDAINIATGDSLNPVEAFSRWNTGTPDPKAWVPSGLAVDSFYVFWGNGQNGTSHGSVLKGSHTSGVLREVHDGVEEVLSVEVTGTHVFFLSPLGVYGVSKSSPTAAHDASQGLVAAAPAGSPWSPVDIAWDGENTLYFSDSAAGALYSLPAQNVLNHNLTKFVDAPNVHGLAVIGFHSRASGRAAPAPGLWAAMALLALGPSALALGGA